MSIFKCKMCGGELEVSENQSVVSCPYCGSSQTLPSGDNLKKNSYFEKANALRFEKEFNKASYLYEILISEFPKEAEAYWGLLLCKYGIEYVDDPKTSKKIPTCHHVIYKSIFDDEDYKKAIMYSDVIARDLYEKEANEINNLQNKICEQTTKEKFDIFICYKETDVNGERTEDSVLAQEIYKKLLDEGYKVFFSRITLEGKIGDEYEPIIFSALKTSKILLHITTSVEHTNSVWVKNEWERFINDLNNGEAVIPCYKYLNPNELPSELRYFQGVDFNKIGAMQDLIYGISKYFNSKKLNDKNEETDVLLPIYQQKINDLLDIDSFCSYSRDIAPIICFFEDNLNYLESKKYLLEAKYQYIKHVETYRDCLQSEIYLEEISPYKDSQDLVKYIKDKKDSFRKKELINAGYLLSIPTSLDVACFNELIKNFLTALKNVKKDSDLDENDLKVISANHIQLLDGLSKRINDIIKESSDVEELERLGRLISSLEKSSIDAPFIFEAKGNINLRIEEIKNEIKANERKKKKKKIRIICIISAVVLAVVGTITGIVVSNKINHSDKIVSFSVQNKTQEYKSDVSPYINGCYYVYFDYKISSSSTVGIQYMNFITYIKKNGSELGKMKTSLDNMNLGAKSSKNYNVYLEDNQPEKNNNTFFITLYNADFSSLSFSFEVLSICFSDGNYYFGPNYNKIF